MIFSSLQKSLKSNFNCIAPLVVLLLFSSVNSIAGSAFASEEFNRAIDGPGCTNPWACNYDPEATEDDGSCEFLSCISFGCTHDIACNYDSEADYDDGSCEYTSCMGCMNDQACDYDPTATIAGVCEDFESCVGCMDCLLYTSPSPRDAHESRMPSSA